MMTLDRQLCFAVYSASHAFSRAYKPLLGQLDLTYPQYLVMLILWENDQQSVKSIATRLHLDSGTLSPLLKRLEKLALVTRTRSDEDERSVIVALTEKGRDMKEEAEKIIGPAIFAATGCTAKELDALREQLLDLRETLEKTAVCEEQNQLI